MEQENFYNKKTILVVDDEKAIRQLLKINLEKEGYNILEANEGLEAIQIVSEQKPNLILLDVMLPGMDGLSICKRIKNMMNIPIIMVTAKDTEIDKILGLEIGADDYITKPFSIRELIARVKANLRKTEIAIDANNDINENNDTDSKKNVIRIGELALDLDKFEVKVSGRVVDLTLREFEVLKYLASERGQVISREVLLEKVWGYEYFGDIRTVDVTVRRIREKIEKDTANPKILMTKRSVGYYIAD